MEARLVGEPVAAEAFARGLDDAEASTFAALVAEFEASRELLGQHLLRADRGGALLPGARFGAYLLERQLGAGSTGVVWQALEEALGRRVALKLLHPLSVVDEAARKRFAREAEAAARLSHPGIAPLLGSGTTHGLDWIAMELAPEGRTLRDWIVEQGAADRALDLRGVAQRLAVLAEALAHCHERRVLHGDPKPSNVVVAPDGSWKWVDFGLARRFGADATAVSSLGSTGRGTPAYLAPELLRATAGDPDPLSEVYSFGAVAYEAIAGLPAATFHAGSAPSRAHHDRRPSLRQLLPEVPPELAWIVERALEPERHHRYSTMAEVAEDLQRFLAGEAPLAGPPSLLRRTASWVRRRPWRAGALAASLSALVLTSAMALRAATLRERTVDLALAATSFVDMLDPDRALELRRTGFEPLVRIGERAMTFDGFPGERAEVLFAVGRALRWSEDFENALPFLEEAMELRREIHGHHSPLALEAELQYAWALARTERDPQVAIPILEEVIATAPRESYRLRALAHNRLGQARIELLHSWDQWLGPGPSLVHSPYLAGILDAFATCDRLLEEGKVEDPGLRALNALDTGLALAHGYGWVPDIARAEECFDRAEDLLVTSFGTIHPELAYVQVGRSDIAGLRPVPEGERQDLFGAGIETGRRIFGEDHAQVLAWESSYLSQARNHPSRTLLERLPSLPPVDVRAD
jgi:serine/threonine protein kinase